METAARELYRARSSQCIARHCVEVKGLRSGSTMLCQDGGSPVEIPHLNDHNGHLHDH